MLIPSHCHVYYRTLDKLELTKKIVVLLSVDINWQCSAREIRDPILHNCLIHTICCCCGSRGGDCDRVVAGTPFFSSMG